MTVLAAMYESKSSLLIGADTGITCGDDDLVLSEPPKLRKHHSAPLAWGATGNTTLGVEDFGGWLSQYSWPPESWDWFRDEAADKLSQLNGRQRALVKQSGMKPTPNDFTRILVAGWLNRPMIFGIHSRGTVEVSATTFYAMGTGAAFAEIAYRALLQSDPRIKRQRAFGISLFVAATRHRYCRPPVNIWRVTRDGVESVDRLYEKESSNSK